MAHDLDRRRNFLARLKSAPVLAAGAASAVGLVAWLAKPINVDVGDITGPLVVFGSPTIYQIGRPPGSTLDSMSATVGGTSSTSADLTAVSGGDFLQFLPSGWNTVNVNDSMSTLSGTKTTCGGSEQEIDIGAWTVFCYGNSWHGGRLTAHPDSLVRDSFTVAGAKSPPYAWEAVYLPGLSGTGNSLWERSISGSPSRVYVEIVMMLESSNSAVGAPGDSTFVINNTETKFFEFGLDNGNLYRLEHTASAFIFIGNGSSMTDPVTGCTFHGLVANNWNNEFPGDTLTVSAPCQNKGRMVANRGVWDTFWICMDLSGATETISFGLNDVIGGYHTGVANMGASLSQFSIEGTWGGGGSHPGTQSKWIDHVTIMTGSSGSCVAP